VRFQDVKDTGAELHLRNEGQVPLRKLSIMVDADWLEVAPSKIGTLEPGGEKRLAVNLSAEKFPASFSEATVVVEGAGVSGSASVRLYPPLGLSVSVEGGPIRMVAEPQMLAVVVRAQTGQATIESYKRFSTGAWLSLVEQDHLPLKLDADVNNSLTFRAVVDAEALGRVLRSDESSASLPLVLATKEFGEVQAGSISCEVRRPASLRFSGAPQNAEGEYQVDIDEVYCGIPCTKTIGLANGGDETLVISQIDIEEGAKSWLSMADIELPLTIEKSSPYQLLLSIDVDSEHGTEALSGAITVNSSSYTATGRVVRVLAYPRLMTQFQGVVAFDYGTTNSCVVADVGSGPIQVILDGDSAGRYEIVPSVVEYSEVAGPERVYSIGRKAAGSMGAAERSRSVVQSAKRWLGTDRKALVRGWIDRATARISYSEVSSDIIRSLVRSAEAQVKARITSCVVTYPVRFSMRQREALRLAYTSCGVEPTHMVPEPVAAGITFMMERGASKGDGDYTLLVCDLGGGTSDFCFFHVTHGTREDGTRFMRPTLLGADTASWIGGDDVTRAIVEDLHMKAEAQIGPIPLVSPRDVTLISNPLKAETGLSNWAYLWALAESLKCDQLYLDGASEAAITQTYSLLAEDGTSLHPTVATTAAEIESRVRPDFDTLVNMSQGVVQRAFAKNAVSSVDVVLLTGNASKFPLAPRCFKSAFPGASFDHIGGSEGRNLKSCVAEGACIIQYNRLFPGGTDIELNTISASSVTVGVMAMNPDNPTVRVLRRVIEVGDALGEWRKAGDFKQGHRIEVAEDAGGGEPSSLMTTSVEEHLPGFDKAAVYMMVDDEQQILVRIVAEGLPPVDFPAIPTA
jgi:molecular chaperone DnaK (HSP70)